VQVKHPYTLNKYANLFKKLNKKDVLKSGVMQNEMFNSLTLSVFFFKDLFIVYEYTVAVFRHTRRGHQISLQVVVSHHVVAGI